MTDATTKTVSTESNAINTGVTLSSGTTTVTQNEDIGNGTEAGNTSPMIRMRFFYLKTSPSNHYFFMFWLLCIVTVLFCSGDQSHRNHSYFTRFNNRDNS